MKVFFSILLNATILFAIQFLLNTPDFSEAIVVNWWWWGWQTFLLGWIILWVLNITIKPILKIIWLPISLFFHSLVVLVINWILLWLLQKTINNVLMLPNIVYVINWFVNFIIAVAIFTILNMLYSILFNKK